MGQPVRLVVGQVGPDGEDDEDGHGQVGLPPTGVQVLLVPLVFVHVVWCLYFP